MPKGPQGQKRPGDVIGAAIIVAKIATGEVEESADPTQSRSNAGKKGAAARSKALTPRERSESLWTICAGGWPTGSN